MEKAVSAIESASVREELKEDGTLVLNVTGRLDTYTMGEVWREAMSAVKGIKPKKLVVDASGISYCDNSGIALFVELESLQKLSGGEVEINNLASDYLNLLKFFKPDDLRLAEEETKQEHFVYKLGIQAVEIWNELQIHISFVGKVTIVLFYALLQPRRIRWKDVLLTSEKFGVNALFIVALVNFLVGLVIAFQSAVPMQAFGAQIYVASLLVIAYFKELGPLMTAFVVNGRSGSAFAAELGTMKVNEELDALSTMGLDSVKFLVVPKIIAAVVMLPILTVFGNLFGLLGGLVVWFTLGFSFISYIDQITTFADYTMLLTGLLKTLVFGLLIAGVGCLEGIRAAKGPSAVGDAATSAVVIGIILLIVVDGVFGVVYYILGI